MTMHVRDGGSWRTVSSPRVRVSGAWQTVQSGWVRVSGVWRQFFSSTAPLSVSCDPGSVSGSIFGGGYVASGSTTAVVTGGTAPYTYSWARTSGDTRVSVSSATASSVYFDTTISSVDVASATFRVTVTDSLSATATGDVDVVLTSDV